MHEIEMHEVHGEFARCWQAAGKHLQSQTRDGNLSWLKADLIPPFLEHLSFRIGNQLFFVRIQDVDGTVQGPGNPDGVRVIAKGCNGVPCLMQMRQAGSEWKPEIAGWGLIHADTGRPLDPVTMISDKKIEMTDWELHDFAVQIVRDHVRDSLGLELISSQGNPGVDPSIWLVGAGGPEWVVVRSARHPEREAVPPENISEIAGNCARLSNIGHFASVAVASSEDAFDLPDGDPLQPLWRGHGMFVRFGGLTPATAVPRKRRV